MMNWEKLLSTERIRKSGKNSNDIRNEFESDFGRIIFSPALRRMHDKTQVFPLTANDNIHSRLTHSNEVMSIGYTFGLKLSSSKIIQDRTKKSEAELLRILPVILKNVCLIHDIGNAPFGHFGETVISDYFENIKDTNFNTLTEEQKVDFTQYDGNAQGLRVITKLQYLNDIYGLNLTYATLAAYLKYPNANRKEDHTIIEKSKHGVFFSEREFFNKIITTCGLRLNDNNVVRHPLAYLMEAADSIAYYIMDIEDGFNTNLLNIDDIAKAFKIDISPSMKESSIRKQLRKTYTNNELTDERKIVNFRIYLMTYLVDLAFERFETNLAKIEDGKYDNELIKDDVDEIAIVLEKLCIDKIFSSREINSLETTGYSVFTGLLNYYIKFLFHENKKFRRRALSLISKSIIDCAIEESLQDICTKRKEEEKSNQSKVNELDKISHEISEYKELEGGDSNGKVNFDKINKLKKEIYNNLAPKFEDLDNYYKFRVILDFISGMTDNFALNHYNNISGQSIN